MSTAQEHRICTGATCICRLYRIAAKFSESGKRKSHGKWASQRKSQLALLACTGGMDGPLFKEVEAANNGRLQLVRGQAGGCQKSDELMSENVSQFPLLVTW